MMANNRTHMHSSFRFILIAVPLCLIAGCMVGPKYETPPPMSESVPDSYKESPATHPGDTARAVTTEQPPGNYTIGPVRFDASGTWTVRFHLNENCLDLTPDSPHGHAAFYLDVP